MTRLLIALALLLNFSAPTQAAAIFNNRASFQGQLSAFVTDEYSKVLYPSFSYSDAAMSAILGETRYQTTGWLNNNLVPVSGSSAHYCAGCNGSFLLDFTSTSVGNADGVFGVGFDIFSDENVFNTTAFVTFGDGSTANYSLPDANQSTGDIFWGITDNLLINSIHFGLPNGGTNTDNSVQRMALDNLTIGAAPEPGTLALLGLGLAGLAAARRRKQ